MKLKKRCPYKKLVKLNRKIERNEKIKDFTFKPIILEFIKWKIIDIIRFKKYGKKPHLYGVRCVTGMYGCGKTVTMTKIAIDYRNKFGNDIYICSNFGLSIQDFPFTSISQTIEQYDKPIIFYGMKFKMIFLQLKKFFLKKFVKLLH